MFTACKLAYIRWDEAKGQFVRAKNTHLCNLLFLVSLAAIVKLLMAFELLYSARQTTFEYILFGPTIIRGLSGCVINAAMVFQRTALISFLNSYIIVSKVFENGEFVRGCLIKRIFGC